MDIKNTYKTIAEKYKNNCKNINHEPNVALLRTLEEDEVYNPE